VQQQKDLKQQQTAANAGKTKSVKGEFD